MLAPPKRQSAGDSAHSEQGPVPDSASVRRVPAQIESFGDAMSRDSSLGIPFNKFFSVCGNYDSVIYGRALSQRNQHLGGSGSFVDECVIAKIDGGKLILLGPVILVVLPFGL